MAIALLPGLELKPMDHARADSQPACSMASVTSERKMRRALDEAIAAADADAVMELLNGTSDLEVAVALRAVWLPLAQELSTDTSVLDGDGQVGRLLRQQIRAALLREPPAPLSRWLVPARPADITATHLAALVLSRLGMGTGMWFWPFPPPGPSLVVGDFGRSSVPAPGHLPIHADSVTWPPLSPLVA